MVQIIGTPNKRSFGQSFIKGAAETLPDALGSLIDRKRRESQLAGEDEALEAQGIHTKGIRDPNLRKALLEQHVDIQKEKQKRNLDDLENKGRSQTIGKTFGPKAAALYNELTEGGKTKFTDFLLDAKLRNQDVDSLLGSYIQENIQDIQSLQSPETGEDQLPGMGNPNVNNKNPPPREIDPDAGLNPEEKVARQEKRYEKNLPLYEEMDAKLRGLEAEEETVGILTDLNESKKLPKGLGRVNVNYKEGNLIVPAFANAETQRYVKTVNEFLNRAKDTFGSRVTNFELDKFLQRLPTLANTEEGRRVILQQMKYFNSIEKTYQLELQKYIDEKGGIRNVDFDVAKRKARERSEPKIKEIKSNFKAAEKEGESIYDRRVETMKTKTPSGYIAVEKDGKFGYIPKKGHKTRLEKEGYRKL